ncbi:unnamed protein product [Paramecium octaurelia]|uniref:Uncharacterized protein n=1 Tax=Paramecium octaurelia TaxID=43137 RepID=A0A8S1W5J8_PAROT|nr:unnamed protein product [Paramecium octaurelia]
MNIKVKDSNKKGNGKALADPKQKQIQIEINSIDISIQIQILTHFRSFNDVALSFGQVKKDSKELYDVKNCQSNQSQPYWLEIGLFQPNASQFLNGYQQKIIDTFVKAVYLSKGYCVLIQIAQRSFIVIQGFHVIPNFYCQFAFDLLCFFSTYKYFWIQNV